MSTITDAEFVTFRNNIIRLHLVIKDHKFVVIWEKFSKDLRWTYKEGLDEYYTRKWTELDKKYYSSSILVINKWCAENAELMDSVAVSDAQQNKVVINYDIIGWLAAGFALGAGVMYLYKK